MTLYLLSIAIIENASTLSENLSGYIKLYHVINFEYHVLSERYSL